MGTPTQTYDVVIAGASFAGLALARAISHLTAGSVRIAVFDRTDLTTPAAPDFRAFAIWASSKHLLERLSLWNDLAEASQPLTSIEISDSSEHDAVRQTRLTYDAKTSSGAPAGYIVPAGRLSKALATAVAADPAIDVLGSTELTQSELGDHFATCQMSDGRVVRCRLLVAADGKASRTRELAGIQTVRWQYDQTGLIATLGLDRPHQGVAIQHFMPTGPFAVLPLRGDQACMTWSLIKNEARRVLSLTPAAFEAEIERIIGGRFGGIRVLSGPQSWPLETRLARDFVATRFAVIGDAAHAVHPIAGQGVNLAFRDCAALAEAVTDSLRLGYDPGHPEALARYARWRRFDTTMSAAAYDGLNSLFAFGGIAGRAGRGAALGVLDQIPELKLMIVREAAGLTGSVPELMRDTAA